MTLSAILLLEAAPSELKTAGLKLKIAYHPLEGSIHVEDTKNYLSLGIRSVLGPKKLPHITNQTIARTVRELTFEFYSQ